MEKSGIVLIREHGRLGRDDDTTLNIDGVLGRGNGFSKRVWRNECIDCNAKFWIRHSARRVGLDESGNENRTELKKGRPW